VLVRLAFWIALSLAIPGVLARPAAAAEACDVSQLRTQERPDPPGVPTRVKIGILVSDVLSVDDVAQAVTVDLIAVAEWRDERLAGLAGCRVPKTAVWFPRAELINSNSLQRTHVNLADRVEIGPGGAVRYVQRLHGPISTYHSLERFPFDRHSFKLRMVIFDYPADDLVIEVDQAFTHLGEQQNIADWEVFSASGSSAIEPVAEFGQSYSVVTLSIDLARSWTFYIWRVIVPMALIVAMSWAVFWISPERYGPQIGLSATAMLTLIAFQFFVASALPKLSYFTILDELVVGSTTLVFLTLVQAMVTAYLVMNGRAERAKRIDVHCRWLFPLLFITWWLAVLL